MSKRKCLLIAWALALLILLVMSSPAPNCRRNPQYPHSFYSNDGCKTLICKVCGVHQTQESVVHAWKQIDCYQRQCTYCGLVDDYESHQRLCSTRRQCADCGKKFEKILSDMHVWEYRYEGCTGVYTCILCGEQKRYVHNSSHQWIAENCEEGQWCRVCGEWNSKSTKHSYYTNLAGLITCCMYCSYTEVTVFTVDWALVAAWLLGILWLTLALCYAVRNRGTFSLNRMILRDTWLDGDDTAPNLRGWRG